MIFATIVQAAQAEMKSPEFISYAPVTWGLLGILIALTSLIYWDLRGQISKLWGHGHSAEVSCHNKTCSATVKTVGVMTKEG